jgi:putative thioredoxin
LIEGLEGDFAAEGLAARIRLEQAKPEDLAPALDALERGDVQGALEGFVSALDGDEERRDEIRKLVVGVLDELGPEHPLAREYRRRLAAALY